MEWRLIMPMLVRKWWTFMIQKASQERYFRRALAERYFFSISKQSYLGKTLFYKELLSGFFEFHRAEVLSQNLLFLLLPKHWFYVFLQTTAKLISFIFHEQTLLGTILCRNHEVHLLSLYANRSWILLKEIRTEGGRIERSGIEY